MEANPAVLEQLKLTPPFATLPDSALHGLLRTSRMVRVDTLQTLVSQDSPGSGLYLMLKGVVRVYIHDPGQAEVTLAMLGKGDMLGELATVDHGLRTATVEALCPVEALFFPQASVAPLLSEHPSFAIDMFGVLSQRLRRAYELQAERSLVDLRTRVIRRLLDVAGLFGAPAGAGMEVAMPMSQDTFASMALGRREGVNREFASLRRDGHLTGSWKRFVIRDLQALRGLAHLNR